MSLIHELFKRFIVRVLLLILATALDLKILMLTLSLMESATDACVTLLTYDMIDMKTFTMLSLVKIIKVTGICGEWASKFC